MNYIILVIVLLLLAAVIYLWRGGRYDFAAIHPASIGGPKIIGPFNPAIWHPAAL